MGAAPAGHSPGRGHRLDTPLGTRLWLRLPLFAHIGGTGWARVAPGAGGFGISGFLIGALLMLLIYLQGWGGRDRGGLAGGEG